METIAIPIGTSMSREYVVNQQDTAIQQHSGRVNVLGTPRLLAIMEEVSSQSIEEYLPEGAVSVGVEMHIYHLKPSVVGDHIVCCSALTKQEGKKLFFQVSISDKKAKLGEGECIRYIVDKQNFETKAQQAAQQK